MQPVTYPGAEAPARSYTIDSDGLAIAVNEWGAADDAILILAHGGSDFSRTFDRFAPMLATAGWRVVAWDQRGHGDSEHGELYSFDADLRDAANVFEAVAGGRPVPVLGHSKGGAMMIALADAQPHRIASLVNIDGMPWKNPVPDISEHERAEYLATEMGNWLGHRRRLVDLERRPDTLDGLAQRRGQMNPRLDADWLRYLVSVGAFESDDGWRWKLDPAIRFGGFGPWRPEWSLFRLAGLAIPFLGILVGRPEPMGWQSEPHHIDPWLPEQGRLLMLDDLGHFPHIESPDRVASIVLEFFGPGESAAR